MLKEITMLSFSILDYVTRSGVEKSKIYISASIVEFTGKAPDAIGEE